MRSGSSIEFSKKRARDLLRLRALLNSGKLYLAVLLLHLLIKYLAAKILHKAGFHNSHLFTLVTRQPPINEVSGNTVRDVGLPAPFPKGDTLVNQVMLYGFYSFFSVHSSTLSRLDNFNGGKWALSGLRSFLRTASRHRQRPMAQLRHRQGTIPDNQVKYPSFDRPENSYKRTDRCRNSPISDSKKGQILDLAPGISWSGKRSSNPRLQPWQGCTLPLSYSREKGSRYIANEIFIVNTFFASMKNEVGLTPLQAALRAVTAAVLSSIMRPSRRWMVRSA